MGCGAYGHGWECTCKRLQQHAILKSYRTNVNLTNEKDVHNFVQQHQPSVIFLCAAKVGGIVLTQLSP